MATCRATIPRKPQCSRKQKQRRRRRMAELNKETLAELIELSRATGGPQLPAGGNVPYVVIPQGYKVEDLSRFVYNEHSDRPERAKTTAKVLDAQSFCDYYTLFHDEHSRVFADETQ